MTRIVLKTPTPVEQRYTISDIHVLVCQHAKEWSAQLPALNRMLHTRAASRVTGVAWFYYCGSKSAEAVAKEFRVSVETVVALARVLGIQPVQRRQRRSQNHAVKINIKR